MAGAARRPRPASSEASARQVLRLDDGRAVTNYKKPRRSHKNAFRHAPRDDERPSGGLRHRMPHRAPMAWPTRRCAHCHLPPRALPDAQPQQHGVHNTLGTTINNSSHHNSSHHQAPAVRSARARSTHKCLALRTRFLPLANRLAPSHMLHLLLHSLLSSLCSLLHSTLQATCTGALAAQRSVVFAPQWSADSPRSKRRVACAMRRRRSRGRRAPVL